VKTSNLTQGGGTFLRNFVNFYQTTRRYIPEESIPYSHRCENPISHSSIKFSVRSGSVFPKCFRLQNLFMLAKTDELQN
jgi:hypothetical protein